MMNSALNKFYLSLVIIISILSSCTKTEIVPYEKEPTNIITEYKVINGTEQLNGVIDNVDNTITVYIPYYLSIDYLVPTVKLNEGATIIDNAGKDIDIREVLEPVPFDTVGYKYRVKDVANSIREYRLDIVIMPHKEELKLGYVGYYDANNIWRANDTATKVSIINARIRIMGNLQSTSRNAKLTLIEKGTNKVIPNGLKFYDITSGAQFYTLFADIAPEVNPGTYYITIEQQGRKDTLPQITLDHKIPYFGQLPKQMKQGDIVTLTAYGPSSNGEVYSGSNPGIKRAYLIFTKQHMTAYPAAFPESLFGKPIEVEITSQNRTQISFKFPETIPAGIYSSSSSTNSGITNGYSINYAGMEMRFDFDYAPWAPDRVQALGAFISYEVLPK
ncbi:hypothetical protein ACLOAU_18430 [Niabella sp. CJ426]|uniref:hypothetical protein n=1 Tax=Niabella sp. CJ426 TaxID=3393740 RepID=UPI003CFDB9A2